jgi:hypothetical protein
MVAAFFALGYQHSDSANHGRTCVVFRLDRSKAFLTSGDVRVVEPGFGIWNQRMRAQQGVFTHLATRECLIDVLKSNSGYLDALTAYSLPASAGGDALQELDSMLINDLRLFPDHEGVIRHVKAAAAR